MRLAQTIDLGGRPWLRWLAWTSVASVAVALVDLLLCTIAAPFVTSSLAGALATWASVTSVLALGSLPFALVAALLDRPSVIARLPSTATLVASLALGVLGVVTWSFVGPVFERASAEFPTEPGRLRTVTLLVGLGALVLARPRVELLARKVLERGEASDPGRGRSLLAMLASFVALYVAHFALGPIHEVDLAGLATLGAVGAMALAARARVHLEAVRDVKIVVGLVVLLGLGSMHVPWGREQARFALFNHSTAAGVAERLRGLVDRDGDRVAARWLGGTDCNDGDARVSPTIRETPGDGIDQDCRGGDAGPPPEIRRAARPADCPPGRYSIVVLLIDALRADAVTPEVMPAAAALLSESWLFERAYSPAAMTLSSTPAILTARAFADVAAENALLGGNLEAPFTIAEKLTEAGYRTIAFSDYLNHPLLLRGFTDVNPHWRDVPAAGVKETLTSAATFRAVLDSLLASEQPAFVWTHISDTHARYKLDWRYKTEGGKPIEAHDERSAYLRGASYVDRQLKLMLQALEAQGRAKTTIIVLTADHGEELRDHGRQGHGPHAFEESLHVPLGIHIPGCAPRIIDDPVVTHGLGPTLGALTRVSIPGVGLVEQVGRPVVVDTPSALETHFKRAVIGKRHKLVLDVVNGGAVLFDLASDPSESTAVDDPAVRGELEAAYQAWLDAPGAR